MNTKRFSGLTAVVQWGPLWAVVCRIVLQRNLLRQSSGWPNPTAMEAEVTGTKERVKELSEQRSVPRSAGNSCVLKASLGFRCGNLLTITGVVLTLTTFLFRLRALAWWYWGPELQVAIFTVVAEAGLTPQRLGSVSWTESTSIRDSRLCVP